MLHCCVDFNKLNDDDDEMIFHTEVAARRSALS